jgi:hypothetical protein
MAKEYIFTIKHFPTNDLLALDLQDHLDQKAKTGWELINTQQLVKEHSSTTPQMIIFWGRNDLQ